MALICIILFAKDNIWFQISSINFITLGSIMFTLWFKPQESKEATYYEVFNDITLLLVTYHMWCFTDIVPEAETRYGLGKSFIGICLGNILVHLVGMFM
mgnify:CR=1 FL=1